MTLPDFLQRRDPEHPLTHNTAAMALRISVRLGFATEDTTPLLLNYGYGQRAFTVEAALAWAERLADEELT